MFYTIGKNILVEPIFQKIIENNSIIALPDGFVNKVPDPDMGKVVYVPDKVDFIKVGDIIKFKKYLSEEVEVDGEKFLIMSEEMVLGFFKDQE